MDLAALSETELQFKVERLLAEYAHCINDDQLESWPDFFFDDCVYKVSARENVERNMPVAAIFCDSKGMLADRIISLRHANVYERHRYRHVVSSTLISDVSDTSLKARSNYIVCRTRINGVTEIFSAGTYDDKIVVVEDQLLFQERIVVYDTDRIDTLLVTPI